MARLILIYQDKELESWELDKTPMVAGRNADAEISIESPAISKTHCRFEPTAHGYKVTDLDSTIGTIVGQEKIKEHDLNNNDEVKLGPYTLKFVTDKAEEAFPGEDEFIPAIEEQTMKFSMDEALGDWTKQKWKLKIVDHGTTIDTQLTDQFIVIGSAPKCDIMLEGKGISPNHAVITQDDMGVRIICVSNKKNIKINNSPTGRRSALTHGDKITIGASTITLRKG